MRRLRYGINVSLDGCVHHEAGLPPDEESMAFWTSEIERAEAILYGRVTYQMMESAWRRPDDGVWPDWMETWEQPFAAAIDSTPKHVVSSTLESVDWEAELVRGDLADAVHRIKEDGDGVVALGGVTLPAALAGFGLIDEYVFVVHPVVAGRGPTLLAGLRDQLRLELVDRREFASGAVASTYRPVT